LKLLNTYKKSRPFGAAFLISIGLFLNLLEDLTLASGLVELLEFELTIHLLLILAGKEDVSGWALYLY
jgi:hypothetical protein